MSEKLELIVRIIIDDGWALNLMIYTLAKHQLKILATKMKLLTKFSFKTKKIRVIYSSQRPFWNSNLSHQKLEFDKNSLFGDQENHFTILLLHKIQP